MKRKKLHFIFSLLTGACLSAITLIAQPPPTAGLTGHFKFDGGLNNYAPTTMSANGSNISYSTNGAGTANKALMFAGTVTSQVNVTDNGNLDFTGDFSIAFGIYLASTASNQGIYDNGLNYGGCGVWYFNSDNTLRFNYRNGSIGAPAALPAGQWRAVCAVRSGSTMSLYVNGILAASGTQGTSTTTYPYAPVFGQMYFAGVGGNYNPISNGSKIDEFRFYNRALSAAEISSLVGYSLPLKMGDFTAAVKPSGIQLNWETIFEQNSAYFDVEHSTNGSDFSAIGKLNAKGNSTDKQYYTYTHAKAIRGVNYYRLKMADLDNSYTYSRILAIKNSSQVISMELFPNPVIHTLQVQLVAKQKERAEIFIADAAGKKIWSRSIQLSEGNNATSIPVARLSKGIYFLSFENNEGKQTQTFIKH
ncbi:MAG TPA: LamG-like jellyroll fold domain-containing protein [Ferruginibacter sp.]|nr:LamG-like jellyroll fold domain-containing protein [Ferruginibacter sp.]